MKTRKGCIMVENFISRSLNSASYRRGAGLIRATWLFIILSMLWLYACSCASDLSGDIPADADAPHTQWDAAGDEDADIERQTVPDVEFPNDAEDGIGRSPQNVVGLCLDGEDQTQGAFVDCLDLECMTTRGCCMEDEREWIVGEFSRCDDLFDCGWTVFPADGQPLSLEPQWVVMQGAQFGETGLYTDAIVDTTGEPSLTFAFALGESGCSPESCRQVVGAALSPQENLSSATGVSPAAGIVLDGEARTAHFIVNGRIESSTRQLSNEEMTRPQGGAIRLRADGRVAFWYGLDVETSGDDPVVEISGRDASYVSLQTLGLAGTELRVVLFGHFTHDGSGSVGGVRLVRPVCDIPNGFNRPRSGPVMTAPDGERSVGRPSVVGRLNEGELMMVHEEGAHLAVATSLDGLEWERRATVLQSLAPTEYGRVARRSPSLLAKRRGANSMTYHLWFEAESEYAGIVAGGLPRNAIVHATSVDGLEWTEEPDEESIAFIGDEGHSWRAEVGQPTVVEMDDETLLMLFVGTHSTTGVTRLGWATSFDWKEWQLPDDPLVLGVDDVLPFERDGVGYPTASIRGNVVHLWYTGYSGARASIGYAVGTLEGSQSWSWIRFGEVLRPVETWEAQRVLAPSVITLPPDELDSEVEPIVGVMALWYAAGHSGLDRIGFATREIPAQLEAPPSEE